MHKKQSLYPGVLQKSYAQIKFYGYAFGHVMRYYWKQISFFLIFILLISLLWKGVFYFQKPIVQPSRYKTSDGYVTIKIPFGISAKAVLDTLERNGLIHHKFWAKTLVRIFGFDKDFKSGLFDIPDSLNTYQTLYYLSHARQKLIKITIPEGLNYKRIAEIVTKKFSITKETFIQLCEDTSFIRKYNIKTDNLEGYLHPETYFFQYDINAQKLLHTLIKEQLKIFEEDSVKKRLNEVGWSIHKVLTLASIIEGEAIVDSEKPLIASVYYNRLKKGMRLQADPTIQYLLKDGPRRLRYRDLQIDSPYNTYKYRGLPPGPINNPGTKSILAALFPAQTDYLYFVAVGDGHHHFSKTLREHNRWKRKFNRIRKKVYGY
jgi:UPF0755 protein